MKYGHGVVRMPAFMHSHAEWYCQTHSDKIVGTLIDNGYLLRTVKTGRKYSDRYELQ